MPRNELDAASFSEDIRDFLLLLHKHDVRYLIIGGEAVIFHGYARLTGDIDFFYELSEENTRRLFATLQEFWRGSVPGVKTADELLQPGVIMQFGVPPNRIDLVNRIDGVDFSEAWPNRQTVRLQSGDPGVAIHYLGLPDLLSNKKAAGRAKDLDDLRYLENQTSD